MKDILRTSRYSKGMKLQSNDNKESFPLQALCASILHDLNEHVFEWPIEFIEIYLEDALGSRMWVDAVQASAFCECITKKYTPQSVSASIQKIHGGEDSDSSSGDEEVLEDSAAVTTIPAPRQSGTDTTKPFPTIPVTQCSSSSIAPNGKSTIYRFPTNHSDAQLVIKTKIESKVGIADGQVTSSGTWSMIETIKTFCHLSSVRSIASKCVDKWILNPALSDQVKDLVKHLTECLEVLDETGCGDSSEHLSGSLTSSDMSVVESIVMLRSKLKAQTQIEVYKAILISIVNKGSAVARFVVKLLVLEDLRAGGMKPDTLKYITNLLLSIRNTTGSASNRSNYDEKGRRSGCIIFAEAIKDICTNSEHWSSIQSKIIIELIAKILRSMDITKVDVASFIGGLLGNTYNASLTLYHGWDDGSNELFKFYSEVIIAVQLLVTHEICVRKSEHMSGHTYMEGHGHNPPPTHKSLSVGGRLPGRGGGLGREGMTLGGRGGGRLGGAPSGMFVGKKLSNIAPKKALQPEVSGLASGQSLSSSSASNQASSQQAVNPIELQRKNLAVQETALAWFHQVFAYYSKNPSRELRDENSYILDWIGKVLCTQQSHTSTILDKIVHKNAAKYTSEQSYLSSKVLISVVDVIKMTVRSLVHLTSGFDFIELLISRTLNRLQQKLGSSSSSSNLQQIGENVGSTRMVNDKIDGGNGNNSSSESKDADECYVEISDHTIVDRLFDLCVVKLQKLNSNRTVVSSSSVYETPVLETNRRPKNMKEIVVIESNVRDSRDRSYSLGSNDGLSIQDTKIDVPEQEPVHPLFDMPGSVLTMDLDKLPKFALKTLYWRACILCFTLGCLKPDTVGNFVWKNNATVRALMLMVMSDRDYFVPIYETVNMEEFVEPLGINMRSYTHKGVVLDVTSHGIRINKSEATRSMRLSHTDATNEICISRLEKDLWTHIFKHDKLLRVTDARHKRTVSTGSSEHETFLDNENDSEIDNDGQDENYDSDTPATKKIKVDAEAKSFDDIDNKIVLDSNNTDESNKMEISEEVVHKIPEESPPAESASTNVTSQSSAEGSESANVSMDIDPGRYSGEFEAPNSVLPPEDIDRFQIAYSTKPIGKLTTPYGKLAHTDVVILSAMGAGRVPPEDVISAVNLLEKKHNFGARLRGSNKPDFISRAIVGDQDQDSIDRYVIEQSANWLIPAIAVDAQSTIERIPVMAAAHLYLVVGTQICRELSNILDWRSESLAIEDVAVPSSYAKYKQIDKGNMDHDSNNVREIVDLTNLNLYMTFAIKIVEIIRKGSTEVAGNVLFILLEDLFNTNLERRETSRISLTIIYKLYQISDVADKDNSELIKVAEDAMLKGPMGDGYLDIIHELSPSILQISLVDILRSIISIETAHCIVLDCFAALQGTHDTVSPISGIDVSTEALVSFISDRGVFAYHLFCTQASSLQLLQSLRCLQASLASFETPSTLMAANEDLNVSYVQAKSPELKTDYVSMKRDGMEIFVRKDFIRTVLFIGALYMSASSSLFQDQPYQEFGEHFTHSCIAILEHLSSSDQLVHFHAHILLFRESKILAHDDRLTSLFMNIKSHKLIMEIVAQGCTSHVFAACQRSMDNLLRSNRSSIESWITRRMTADPSLLDIMRNQMSMCVQLGIDVDTVKAKEREEKEKERAEKAAEKAALAAEKAAAAAAAAPVPTRVSTRERVPTAKFAESIETGMFDGKGLAIPNSVNSSSSVATKSTSPFYTLIYSHSAGPVTRSSANASAGAEKRKRELAVLDDIGNDLCREELMVDLNLPSTLPTLLLSDKVAFSMGNACVEELKRALLELDVDSLQDLLKTIEKAISSMGVDDIKSEVIPVVDALCHAVYEANINRDNSKQVPLFELVLFILSLLPISEYETALARITIFPTKVPSLSFDDRKAVLLTFAFKESKHSVRMLGKILLEADSAPMDSDLLLMILQKCVDSSCIYDEESHGAFAELIPSIVNFFADSCSSSLSDSFERDFEKLGYDLGLLVSRRLEYTLQWAKQFTRMYFSKNSASGPVLSVIRHVMFCGYEKFPIECLGVVDKCIESIISEEGGVETSVVKSQGRGRPQKSKTKGRVAAKVEGIDDRDDELEMKSFKKAERLQIFHMLMLCEQDNVIHRGVDGDRNFGVSHLLPWSDMQSATTIIENSIANVNGGDNLSDASAANIAHHDSIDMGTNLPIVSSDRCCYFDTAISLALHVIKFMRGVDRNYELRSKEKSIKAEFVFLEDTSDQTSYVKEASQYLEYIALNFPSLWFRYVPALLDALKHSLMFYSSKKSSPSSLLSMTNDSFEQPHSAHKKGMVTSAQYLETSTGSMTHTTVSFYFHGCNINEVLWSTILLSLKSIPSSLLQHPSAFRFGIDDLNSEFRDLYRKRQLYSSVANLLPSPATLQPTYACFPKPNDVSLVLYDFIYKNGGNIHESKLYHFFKKYPECKEVVNRYDLKELCSHEHCNGCIRWEGAADDSCSISCQTRYTEKMERSIIQVKTKFKDYRKAVDELNCFEMNTKLWLLEESILNDSVKYDMQRLITLYTSKYGYNASLL